jgi:hypothetical protein
MLYMKVRLVGGRVVGWGICLGTVADNNLHDVYCPGGWKQDHKGLGHGLVLETAKQNSKSPKTLATA